MTSRLLCLFVLSSISLASGQEVLPTPTCPSADDLKLPPGFCASVFAEGVGRARHLTVSASGDVYVMLWSYNENAPAGSIVLLRDPDGDGTSDSLLRFGERGGDDIEWRAGYLYASTSDSIVRYKIGLDQPNLGANPEVVVRDIPAYEGAEHAAHPFVFANGKLLVHLHNRQMVLCLYRILNKGESGRSGTHNRKCTNECVWRLELFGIAMT